MSTTEAFRAERMVEANIIEASDRQHRTYDNCKDKTLIVGQHVLLSKAGTPDGQAPGQLQDSRAQQPLLYRWGKQ